MKCEWAFNGLETLNLVKSNVVQNQMKLCDYQLILLDSDMPIMNGYQASKKIIDYMNLNKLKLPTIVSVSGNSSREHELLCEQCGMNYTLQKPVNGQELKDILDLINFPKNRNES